MLSLDFSNRPLLMGVLNVTPDSFSDGGRFVSLGNARRQAERMAEEGAHLIDVGGESTRPGAKAVPLEEELGRVLPLVKELAKRFPNIPLSIDTAKAEVARQCLEEGASLVNDVSALRADPEMPRVVREHNATALLMHMRGDPRTMQQNPVYQNVTEEIKTFFRERIAFAASNGIPAERLFLDPGIGFGKTVEHNLCVLRNLKSFLELGRPLVIGASRKSFIGKLLGSEESPVPPEERAEGSLAVHLWAAAQGAHILRVHDVGAAAKALKIWRSLERADAAEVLKS